MMSLDKEIIPFHPLNKWAVIQTFLRGVWNGTDRQIWPRRLVTGCETPASNHL